jgi:hypothetical protein
MAEEPNPSVSGPASRAGLRILDCKAADHSYLHQDFHGALCYAIKYLDDHYGPAATEEFLRQVGRSCFAPLGERLKSGGLDALAEHWREVFGREGGKISLEFREGALVLTVDECPAIAHLKKIGQFFTTRYCETTAIVNETVCAAAGYRSSCEYEAGAGRCVQKFWKHAE